MKLLIFIHTQEKSGNFLGDNIGGLDVYVTNLSSNSGFTIRDVLSLLNSYKYTIILILKDTLLCTSKYVKRIDLMLSVLIASVPNTKYKQKARGQFWMW